MAAPAPETIYDPEVELRRQFQEADKDGSGEIDASEARHERERLKLEREREALRREREDLERERQAQAEANGKRPGRTRKIREINLVLSSSNTKTMFQASATESGCVDVEHFLAAAIPWDPEEVWLAQSGYEWWHVLLGVAAVVLLVGYWMQSSSGPRSTLRPCQIACRMKTSSGGGYGGGYGRRRRMFF
eukprot:Skav233629  [mRNA]  locus=scaffold492:65787:71200:- [translate_table: standard]